MDEADRQTLLSAAAVALGLSVWTWDATRRICSFDAEAARSRHLPDQASLDEWISTIEFADRDRARHWLLDRGRSEARREIEIHVNPGTRRHLVEIYGDGPRFVIAEQNAHGCEDAVRRSLQDFLYAVSHDLQEPLRMVASYTSLIDARHADALPPDAREHLRYVLDGADRLQAMLQALLELSRIETRGSAFEPIDLDLIMREVQVDLELAIEETGARIHMENLPTVMGDEKQLYRLFFELVDNAIKFQNGGPPEIRVTCARVDPFEVITVANRGIPIAMARAEQIFRPFERLHAREDFEGLGTGLTLARRITERHGGGLDLVEAPDGWNHFAVRLTPP